MGVVKIIMQDYLFSYTFLHVCVLLTLTNIAIRSSIKVHHLPTAAQVVTTDTQQNKNRREVSEHFQV